MDPLERITKHSEHIRLNDAERFAIRARLLAHMEVNPVLASPYAGSLLGLFFSRAAVALAVLFVIGGGTAYAAEGALPGEPLYPLKVAVVEPAIGALQASPSAKAEWQVTLADRRLAEADKLAASDKLEDGTEDETADAVADALDKAQVSVEALAATDQEEGAQADAKLSAALTTHEAVLAKLSAAGNTKAASALARVLARTASSSQGGPIRAAAARMEGGDAGASGGVHAALMAAPATTTEASSTTAASTTVKTDDDDRGPGDSDKDNDHGAGHFFDFGF